MTAFVNFVEDIPYYFRTGLGKALVNSTDAAYSCGKFLDKSFVDYHDRLVQTFDELPANGKVQEVALRIIAVAAAPLLYPLLG
ncbi:MAG TPA: hypothetical protein VGP47_02315, partial [Parachlamydiaceae bacterium]|nr:hypothetical protein [Parachlamydiaceae bacterium]